MTNKEIVQTINDYLMATWPDKLRDLGIAPMAMIACSERLNDGCNVHLWAVGGARYPEARDTLRLVAAALPECAGEKCINVR